MKKMIILAMAAMLILGSYVSAETSFLEKAKVEIGEWDFSLGGCAYVPKQKTFYYSIGIQRDLGQFFNWLDDDRLYFDLGYLNSKMIGDEADTPGKKEYRYMGLSTNANFLVQQGIRGINKLTNGNFKTPELFDKILATVGVLGAKELDKETYDLRKGWDIAFNVAVIKRW